MKLLVGLGNPGAKYNFTRHNFGFLALDFYAKIHHLEWQKGKMNAIWLKKDDILFIKPQSFYNDCGIPVHNFLQYYKIPLENILVIADDFNLEFGTIRYRARGSDGGNNGLKSIIAQLKTNDFARLRLGTNNDLRAKMPDPDFVLSRFSEAEKTQLPTILTEVSQKISDFCYN